MKKKLLCVMAAFLVVLQMAYAQTHPPLGTAGNFTVLAGTEIVNTGNTVIEGAVGVSPGGAVTGFPPGIINGLLHLNNSTAQNAQSDLTAAYNHLVGQPATLNLTGQNLGGLTLMPGVYSFNDPTYLTGTLTLDGAGDPGAIFIFQINSDFTVTEAATMVLQEGARARNIFWQVSNTTSIADRAIFKGSLLANESIVAGSEATIQGRLMSRFSLVSFTNTSVASPLPTSYADLEVAKTVSAGPYYVGSTITYTIKARNLGPSHEQDVLVRDLLPAGLTYVSSTTTTPSSTYSPVTGIWSLDTLTNGASETLSITARIASIEYSPFITNTATIAGEGRDASTGNNTSTAPICSAPQAPGQIGGKRSVCQGSTDNTYTIVPVTGATFYKWTVPDAWEIIHTTQDGTSITVAPGIGDISATIFVTAGNTCDESLPSSLQVFSTASPPPALGPISSSIAAPCAGSSGHTYSVAEVAGAEKYEWTVPSDWTIIAVTSEQGRSVMQAAAGAMEGEITVAAYNGCGWTEKVSLQVKPSLDKPAKPAAISGLSNVCAGDEVTYSVEKVEGVSYTWTIPDGWGPHPISGQGSNAITVKAGPGGGSITVAASNSCGASTTAVKAVLVSSTKPAAPERIIGQADPCVGTEYAYSIDPIAGAISYSWSLPDGSNWVLTRASQDSTTIWVTAGSEAGNISVTASNACGTGDTTALLLTPVPGAPENPGVINGESIPCRNSSDNIFWINEVTGASKYLWTLPQGWEIIGEMHGDSIRVKAGTSDGTISVVASNGCGNSASSFLAVSAAVAAPAQPGSITGESIPCIGSESVEYKVAPVAGASSYYWTLPEGWDFIGEKTNATIKVKAGSVAGIISVQALNGCDSSLQATLTVKPTSSSAGTLGRITGESVVCRGETGIRFSIGAIDKASAYTWTVPETGGWKITGGQGTTEIMVTAGSTGGTVSVRASNGCSQSEAVTWAVTASEGAPGSLGDITGSSTPCNTGAATATYRIAGVSGALSYTWVVPDDWDITAGQNTTEITVRVGALAGSVSVMASNGCGDSPVSTLEVTPASTPPSAPGPVTGNSSLCVGQQGLTYSIEPVTGTSFYTWTMPDPTWTILSGQGTTSVMVNAGTAAGTIEVNATNGCGTGGASAFTTTFLPAASAPERIIDESAPCKGLVYAVAEVKGASSYTWTVPQGWTITSGQGTSRINVKANSPAGEISVVSINTYSCESLPVRMQADAAKGESELIIPNAYSPNGDGINETWMVHNLEKFADNDLVILNRWGSEVHRKMRYQGDWNGNGLSAGTYFYVLRVKQCDGVDKTFRGYVMIVK